MQGKNYPPAQPSEADRGYINSSKPQSARLILQQFSEGPTTDVLSSSSSLQCSVGHALQTYGGSMLCLGIDCEKLFHLETEYARDWSNHSTV